MPNLLTPEEAASKLGVTIRTLREWRKNAYGPKHLRLSHTKVRYKEEDINSWLVELSDLDEGAPV